VQKHRALLAQNLRSKNVFLAQVKAPISAKAQGSFGTKLAFKKCFFSSS
jgi:hypothetical protein